MAKEARRQFVSRLCIAAVDLDGQPGDTDRDYILAAMKAAMTNGDNWPIRQRAGSFKTAPEDTWFIPPLRPEFIRPYRTPMVIPASQLTGQEALTTEPVVPEDVVIPPDGLEVPDEVAAQIAGGVEGAEMAEEDEGDDEEDMAELMVRYLDLEDLLDQKRTKGDSISQEEIEGAREMRAELRAAYAGVEAEFDAEEIVELAPDKDVEEVPEG